MPTTRIHKETQRHNETTRGQMAYTWKLLRGGFHQLPSPKVGSRMKFKCMTYRGDGARETSRHPDLDNGSLNVWKSLHTWEARLVQEVEQVLIQLPGLEVDGGNRKLLSLLTLNGLSC